jgi:tetratricopeptide (TPR) repeat protein
MRYSILAVLTLALAAPAFADKKLDDAIAKAEEQFQKGKPDEAIKTLQKAISQSPASPEGHLALARIQQRVGSLNETADALKQAIANSAGAPAPLKADIYTYASSFALVFGTGREAVAHAEEAVKIQPGAASYAALARAQVRAQDPVGALATAQKALQAGASSALAHEAHGDALAALRRYDEAMAAYRKALQLDSKLNRARVGLAAALVAAGKPSEAVAEARQATTADERDAEAFAALGSALLAENPQQKWSEAIAEAQQGAFLNPRSVLVQVAVGKIFEAAGNYDQATEAYKKAFDVDPGYAPASIAVIRAQERRGDLDGALAAAKRLVEQSPTSGEAQFLVGSLLMRKDDIKGAQAHLVKATELTPGNAEAHAYAGTSYQYSGQTEKAVAAYAKAVELDPKNLAYRATYGLLLGIAERYVEGAAELQKVVATPGYKESAGYTNLGWLYRNMTPRKTAEAVAAYKRALELDPKNGQAALGMGWAYSYQRSYDDAIAAYQQTAKIDASLQDEAYNGIAWGYFFKRDLEQAKQWLDKAGKAGRADRGLGEQIEKLEKLQAQREAYEEAMRKAEEERAKGPDLGTLARQATTGDTASRLRAVRELRALGAQAVPALIRVLDPDNPMPVREAAINALGDIGPSAKQAVPYLMEVLRTECGKTVMEKKEMEAALKCEELKLKARDAVLKIQK